MEENIEPLPVKIETRYSEFDPIVEEKMPTLSLSVIAETDRMPRKGVHHFTSMITVTAPQTELQTKEGIDFVVALDTSGSMGDLNKLIYAKATLDYLIDNLRPIDRIHIITFSSTYSSLTEGLIHVDDKVRFILSNKIRDIIADGCTNIWDTFIDAIRVIREQSVPLARSAVLMFFTDGNATVSLISHALQRELESLKIPDNLTVFSFGYGRDHESSILEAMAKTSKEGVYYYIESNDNIATIFSECMNGILSTMALQVCIKIIANSGCRIENSWCSYPRIDLQDKKSYLFQLGSLFSGESRNILLDLNLRDMESIGSKTDKTTDPTRNGIEELIEHTVVQDLISVELSYLIPGDKKNISITRDLAIQRTDMPVSWNTPVEIEKQRQRIMASMAISQAIKQITHLDRTASHRTLMKAINNLSTFMTRMIPNDPNRLFYQDLLKDLTDCLNIIKDNKPIHHVRCLQQMHSKERATGTNYFKELTSNEDMEGKNTTTGSSRSIGYGYSTSNTKNKAVDAIVDIDDRLDRYS